jgi:SAM-dependent methyltransferase
MSIDLFEYHIDSPTNNLEITSSLFFVSGWIAAEATNSIEKVMLCNNSQSFSQPLNIVRRDDVENIYPQCNVVGFSQYISVLEIPQDELWSVQFLVNGQECSFPLAFSIAPSLKKLRYRKIKKLKQIQSYLQCPVCESHNLKSMTDDLLYCKDCHSKYPYSYNNYNFLTGDLIKYGNVKPTENISANEYDPIALDIIQEFAGGLILDNGSGLRNTYYDNVVNFEVVNYPTTDILGIGEKLPFKSNSFDAVFSFAVLEHVKNPFECAREIVRVLKPGGKLYAVVPFLQPFHGYPDHYYNMTSSGLKNLFETFLDIVDCGVPLSGVPIWCLSWFLNSYVRGLPEDAAQKFKEMKIGELLASPIQYLEQDFVRKLNQNVNEELACTNYIVAIKK